MHTDKQMNASYQALLVNRHIRRFTGSLVRSFFQRIYLPIGDTSYSAQSSPPYSFRTQRSSLIDSYISVCKAHCVGFQDEILRSSGVCFLPGISRVVQFHGRITRAASWWADKPGVTYRFHSSPDPISKWWCFAVSLVLLNYVKIAK